MNRRVAVVRRERAARGQTRRPVALLGDSRSDRRLQRRRRQRVSRLRGARRCSATAPSASPPTARAIPSGTARSPLRIAARLRASARNHHDRRNSRPDYRANPGEPLLLLQARALHAPVAIGRERGVPVIVDGNNADDRGDYRPGRQAAREFGVRSPLDEVDLTKDEIRELSREAGLPTWDEPASACLSSRIPYFIEVTDEKLRMIERAENVAARPRLPRVPRPASRHCRPARDRPRRDGARARARGGRRHRPRAARDRLPHVTLDLRGLSPRQPQRRAATAPDRDPRCARGLRRRSRRCSCSRHLRFAPARRSTTSTRSTSRWASVDFDVAQHQPHPPGYPLFIALGKLSTPVLRAAGVASPEVRGLAVWSALAGAGLLLLVFTLWRTLDPHPLRPALAAVMAAASPLFWFTVASTIERRVRAVRRDRGSGLRRRERCRRLLRQRASRRLARCSPGVSRRSGDWASDRRPLC